MAKAMGRHPTWPELAGNEVGSERTRRAGDALDRFLAELRPLLKEHSAHSAWIFGSHARGTATPESDIDVIVVASTHRLPVERFRDYLPAILKAGTGVDLFVYTPAEFEQMLAEERPFLSHAMKSARPIHVG